MTVDEFINKWYNPLPSDREKMRKDLEAVIAYRQWQVIDPKCITEVHEWNPTMNLRWKRDYEDIGLQQEWECTSGERRWQNVPLVY